MSEKPPINSPEIGVMPSGFTSDFHMYMSRVREIEDERERTSRAIEAFQKIMNEELPTDPLVVTYIAEEVKHLGNDVDDLYYDLEHRGEISVLKGLLEYEAFHTLMMDAQRKALLRLAELKPSRIKPSGS